MTILTPDDIRRINSRWIALKKMGYTPDEARAIMDQEDELRKTSPIASTPSPSSNRNT